MSAWLGARFVSAQILTILVNAMSRSTDNCRNLSSGFRLSNMNHWLDNTLRTLQFGESLVVGSVEVLSRGWKTSTEVIGKLCTGADRWHAAIRDIQTPVNLADILRARGSH
jgi:hypothetical protein